MNRVRGRIWVEDPETKFKFCIEMRSGGIFVRRKHTIPWSHIDFLEVLRLGKKQPELFTFSQVSK